MQRHALSPVVIAPLCLAATMSCTPGQLSRTRGEIVSSVVLAGSAAGTGTSSPSSAPAADRVLGTADQYLGVPYKWGGSSPDQGFDCSGFVRYVYRSQGVRLPRTSREQAAAGQGITARVASLRSGDLLLFAESRQQISHVAIYAGDGRIIHSSSSGHGVRYDELTTRRGRWFVDHMVKARRLAVDGRSLVQSLDLLAKPGMPFDPPDHAPAP